ncbi:MAG: ZIP family metal transporter [Halanaeroarchaeum sp.]
MRRAREDGFAIRANRARGLAVVTLAALAVVVAAGLLAGRGKLVGIALFGFVAMMAGTLVRHRGAFESQRSQVVTTGLASGAMIASAAAIIAPKAIGAHPAYGGFAIALGYLLGYGAHELGHLFTHRNLPVNATAAELTLHALAAGSIMGVVYGALPALSAVFGYGIVAHKFPAGFTGAAALERSGLPVVVMVVPASAVALAAVPLSLLVPALPAAAKAIAFGVSAGVFAHVGVDMLPECSHAGSHADPTGHGVHCSREDHRLRLSAVLSTFLGAGVLFSVWQVLAMG